MQSNVSNEYYYSISNTYNELREFYYVSLNDEDLFFKYSECELVRI